LHVILCAVVLACAATARSQEAPEAVAELERLVRDGSVELLDARLKDKPSPESLRMLAQAQTNKAARVREARQRHAAFEDADRRYRSWTSAMESARGDDPRRRSVQLAEARVEHAGMLLGRWISADMDELELSNGRSGDRARLLDLLTRSRKLYDDALAAIRPLLDELEQGGFAVEDELLALGIFDTLRRLRLDIDFNIGWASVYAAIVDTVPGDRRAAALRTAERKFQGILDSGVTGLPVLQCQLGLAIALRELGRYDEAEKRFAAALSDEVTPALRAQISFERARNHVAAARFDDARSTLRPLVEKGVQTLSAEEAPAQFYFNLAQLWDAHTYMLEAERLVASADSSAAKVALERRAQRLRDSGLARFDRLAARGGAWQAAAQHFLAASLRLDADPATQSPLELLIVARQLAQQRKYVEAVQRLRQAAGRKDLDRDMAAEILHELGVCQYQRHEPREAAQAFARLAVEYKTSPRAAQAATYAYQLWAQIAEQSRKAEDYQRLADVLLNLLETFPEHEKRRDAMWWLPVALQSAGAYTAAAEHFGKLPADHPQREEARFRRLVCERLALESVRQTLAPEEFGLRARKLAALLAEYASASFDGATAGDKPGPALGWSASAAVQAAELFVAPPLLDYNQALQQLKNFETRYPGSELAARALTVRIKAYGGQRQFDVAARAVEQYLQAVPADEAGTLLVDLAAGMQEEVERLASAGRVDDARRLAGESINTFEQLEKWAAADAARARSATAVSFGLARMYYVADRLDDAAAVIKRLIEVEPRNGAYQRLHALILSGSLGQSPQPAAIAGAKDAWGKLLADPALRAQLPERYWEARYHWLSLHALDGRADEVRRAIEQERIWDPQLGGGDWRARFEQLYAACGGRLPDSQPASSAGTSSP
jgi:TolA-binding protein